jgi:hypothetical protein
MRGARSICRLDFFRAAALLASFLGNAFVAVIWRASRAATLATRFQAAAIAFATVKWQTSFANGRTYPRGGNTGGITVLAVIQQSSVGEVRARKHPSRREPERHGLCGRGRPRNVPLVHIARSVVVENNFVVPEASSCHANVVFTSWALPLIIVEVFVLHSVYDLCPGAR